MYREEWTEAELEQLAKANADDPTTWPERSVQDLEDLLREQPSWVEEAYTGLGRLRELILEEELKKRLAMKYTFLGEALEALRFMVGKESPGWKIADHLELEVPYGLVADTVEACMELVPRLNKALPFEDVRDILEAMRK